MAELIRDGKKVTMVFGVADVFNNTANFSNHREYITWFFKKHGFEITRWNWGRDPDTGHWEKDPKGIEFKSTDRQVDLRVEVIGELGVNLREIRDA